MNWQHFLNDVFLGNAETIGFVKRLMGYIASGEKEEQIIPIIYGPGRTGKTTFVEALKGAMGEECVLWNYGIFDIDYSGLRPRPELMQLKGAKMLVFFDNLGGNRNIAFKLKKLASDEWIVARYPYDQDFSLFKNKSTPMLVTNGIPGAVFCDKALSKRAVIIPFQARFTSPRPNLRFKPAVVRSWIMEGMTDWMNFGLKIPAACRIAAFGKRAA